MNNIIQRCFSVTTAKHLINISSKRGIYTRSIVMEKAVQELGHNPYFDKYANKITALQQTLPEQFTKRIENAKENKMKRKEKEEGHDYTKVADKGKSTMPQYSYAFAPQKKLHQIMKVELLQDKTPEEIIYIWNQHFHAHDSISGSLSPEKYEIIQNRATMFPSFIFPLPRNQGYEFILAQFAAQEIHFTSLINYQSYQENAPECLTIVHYPDLSHKGIILLHGEYNKNIINAQEAQFLANQVSIYYGGEEGNVKLRLLKEFHESPNKFKHSNLIDQIENIDLSILNKDEKK